MKEIKQSKAAQPGKGNGRKKLVLYGVGAGLLTLAGYFLYTNYRSKKKTKGAPGYDPSIFIDTNNDYKPPKDNSGGNYHPPTDDFPLQSGRKGTNVRALQQALIHKHGKTILPRWGADGVFGKETIDALIKLGHPIVVSREMFQKIVKGNPEPVKPGNTNNSEFKAGGSASSGGNYPSPLDNPQKLASSFNIAIITRNFLNAVLYLRTLKNPSDYSQTSEAFKKLLFNRHKRSLLTVLLDVFSSAEQKAVLYEEFERIGLQRNGDKWSIPALGSLPQTRQIITIMPALVWRTPQEYVEVPARTVLGIEKDEKGDYTRFESNGHLYVVESAAITYYTT
jgi:hypothetical protein